MAHLVVGLQRSGRLFQDFPPLRFMILFAGIRCATHPFSTPHMWPLQAVLPRSALFIGLAIARLRIAGLDYIYEAIREVPACHIIGDKDPVKQVHRFILPFGLGSVHFRAGMSSQCSSHCR